MPTLSESGTAADRSRCSARPGVLAGTPTQSGSFPITFTATNGVGSPATQAFTLTVNTSGTAPAITSANHTTFTEGSAGTFTVTATGSPTPTLAESGTLPTGVTFTPGTGVLAGTPTQSGSFPITFTATNGVGSPATQAFTLTVNTSGTGPSLTMNKASGLVGHQTLVISGTGWGADATVTLHECTTTEFKASSCGSSNAVTVTLDPHGGSGASGAGEFGRARLVADNNRHGKAAVAGSGVFSRVHFTIEVGRIGPKKKNTCGLATSGPCFIVARGNTGDSTSSGPLGFSVPMVTAKDTSNVLGNSTDRLTASGFPGGDTVVALECGLHIHAASSALNHCDSATSISGVASAQGRVLFKPKGITLLVGSAFVDAAHSKCPAGGTCEIVVIDTSNSAIGAAVPVTFATPTVSLNSTSGVTNGFADKIQASGFPVGDTAVARECDQGVHLSQKLESHCDPATELSGSVSSKGQVAFSPGAITLVDGSAYQDMAHQSCPPGGTCEVVVSDSGNSGVAIKTPVSFAP